MLLSSCAAMLSRMTNSLESPQALAELWERHVSGEFTTRDVEVTLATMVADAYGNHMPVLTGGIGKEVLRDFYARRFIPRMTPDTTIRPLSRTIGDSQIVDEMIFRFTDTLEMDWMLPGIALTNRRVEIPLVVIVQFRDGRAYLLGSGFRAGADWLTRSRPPAGRRHRIRA
jgi:carboxymethylenebutenolidase